MPSPSLWPKTTLGEPVKEGCRLFLIEAQTAGDGIFGVFTTPSHHSLGDLLDGNVEVDRDRELLLKFGEHRLEAVGLLGGAEAIEQDASRHDVVLRQTLGNSGIMMSSTKPPAFMMPTACCPGSVPASTAARDITRRQVHNRIVRRYAVTGCPCPSLTYQITMRRTLELTSEPLVVPHHQLAVDLLHRLGETPTSIGSEMPPKANPAPAPVAAESVPDGGGNQDRRHERHCGDEQGAREGDPRQDLGEVSLGLRTGTDTGNEAALLADRVGLLSWVGRIAV